MAQPPPPSPAEPATPPEGDTRRATLVRELSAENLEADTEALLKWDLARHLEMARDPAGAVKAYLACYNLSPGFRPPLEALVRIFRRRRSFKNLRRLLDATVKAAANDEERASAMLDSAAFAEHQENDLPTAAELVDRAVEADPTSRSAARALERLARQKSDVTLTVRALKARIATADDPVLKGLLLHDLATAHQAAGDLDAAVAAIDAAAELPAVRWRSFTALERLARQTGRHQDLARALAGLGEIALAVAKGEETEGSGAFRIERFADERRAAGEACACLYEAALIYLEETGQVEEATALLAQTVALRPEDPFLRRAYIQALRKAGNAEEVSSQVARLAEADLAPELAASLLYDAALATHPSNHDGAMETLAKARELAPHSAALRATTEHWLLEGGYLVEWVESLERDTSPSTPEERDQMAMDHWRAAIVASRRLGDFGRAQASFKSAVLNATESLPILRDYYEECLSHGEYAVAAEALEAMWGQELDDDERSVLHADRIRLAMASNDASKVRENLIAALEDPTTRSWSPDAARLFGASNRDWELLIRAHETRADEAPADDSAAAAYAAAARAARLSGDDAQAEALATKALDRIPGHRYSVALLEEVLRAQGRAEEVVALLRNAANAQAGPGAAVLSLLLAGAAAEAAGDAQSAAESYEQAADHDPEKVSPLWALARLGARQNDDALVLRALEALSERELAVDGAGHATLALGEHYAFKSGKPELAERALEACLQNDELAPDAAMVVATLPEDQIDPALRIRAVERLAQIAPEDQTELLHEAAISAYFRETDLDAASRIAELLAGQDEDDRFAALHRLFSAKPQERPDAWLALASATDDVNAADGLTLHGLRSMIATHGDDAADDAFLLAQDLGSSDGIDSAVAIDESLEASDDADARAEALLGRIRFSSTETSPSLLAGAGRAATAAKRNDAVQILRAAQQARPDDLAGWEAMRVAARDASEWELVAEACDRLSEAMVEGDFFADLVEEGCAVRMDFLGDDDGARQRLESLFAVRPDRLKTYHRLHDLLAEAGDTQGLARIVGARVAAIDDGDELGRLFYEQARLHRSHGELDAALLSLENLSMLDEGHVGGIALAIEINVSLEKWDEAVDALRALAAADVPDKQRRIALLGAADFLERKKGDADAAFLELKRIEELGLADHSLYTRMAELAMRANRNDDAVRTLLEAADRSTGAARAKLLRQAGAIQRDPVGDTAGALLSYRQSLSIEPTNLESAEAVATLLNAAEQRHAHAEEFAAAVRTEMGASIHEDDIRKLVRAAEWRGDRTMREALHEVFDVLSFGDAQERTLTTEVRRPLPNRALSDAEMRIFAQEDFGPAAEIARAAEETLTAMDGLDLGTLGVSRKSTVSKDDRVREMVEKVSAAFGLELGEVYRGGANPLRVTALPGKRDRTDWVVGPEVRGSLGSSHMMVIGMQAYAALRGWRGFAHHSTAKGTTMLYATCVAADAGMSSGAGRAGLAEWARAAERAQSRRARKAVAAAASSAGDAKLEAFVESAHRAMQRAALLICLDLRAALTAVLDAEPSQERVLASERATELVHFWVSPSFIELRKAVGLP